MKDPILKSLKIRQKGELSADAFDCLVDYLALFFRAGGVIDWNLWKRLTADTKAGMVAANERVQAERAAAVGMATQGPRQAARVMSVSDGGELDLNLCLDEFSDQLGDRASSRKKVV